MAITWLANRSSDEFTSDRELDLIYVYCGNSRQYKRHIGFSSRQREPVAGLYFSALLFCRTAVGSQYYEFI